MSSYSVFCLSVGCESVIKLTCQFALKLFFFFCILAVCSANLTVVFVVDGSYKMGDANFTEVGNFVGNVSRYFDVAINKTWIITAVQGNETNVYKINEELNNITLHYPNTSRVLLGKALEMVKVRLGSNDTQRDAAIVVVLITSHKSDDDIAVPTIDLKRMNATIFAVAIGDGVSLGQMKEIASNPDDHHLIKCNDINDLLAKSLAVVKKVCQGKDTSVFNLFSYSSVFHARAPHCM